MMKDDKDFTHLAKIFKILGHPLRLKILLAIHTKKCRVTGIVECFDEPQPIVSQQLAILRNGNIIKGDKNKNCITYKIVDKVTIKIIKQLIDNIGCCYNLNTEN